MFATNTLRVALFDELEQAIALLRTAVPQIPALWMSGSFVSDKPAPSDIDVVFIIEDATLSAAAAADPANIPLITRFVDGRGLKQLGLRVDSYVLQWRVNPSTVPRDQQDVEYHQARGYWDDFWQRTRSGSNPPIRQDALPLRGYLEVMIDGYV